MDYGILRNNTNNKFYPVSANEISIAENEMGIKFPNELKKLYMEIGYGFLASLNNNINRIMDPLSVRDFRLRQNDFKYYPDIEIYDNFEEGRIIFFEANECVLISIQANSEVNNKIYYYDEVIADSLDEFIKNMQNNDEFYIQ